MLEIEIKDDTCWQGYVYVYIPEHHLADEHGYIQEHRLIMEKYLGRDLKSSERVHHIDGNKSNNIKENLMLFESESDHQKYHFLLRTGRWSKL